MEKPDCPFNFGVICTYDNSYCNLIRCKTSGKLDEIIHKTQQEISEMVCPLLEKGHCQEDRSACPGIIQCHKTGRLSSIIKSRENLYPENNIKYSN